MINQLQEAKTYFEVAKWAVTQPLKQYDTPYVENLVSILLKESLLF